MNFVAGLFFVLFLCVHTMVHAMSTFHTSTGIRTVETWGYILHGPGGRPLDAHRLSSATHDLLVTDLSLNGTTADRFSAADIMRMKDGMGGQSVVASYLSIGEASDFRDYWAADWTGGGKASGNLSSKAPAWLGPVNADWPESRKVRYWDPDWQKILFNDTKTGELDAVVNAGFDAAYLDIVDAYHFWGTEAAAKDKRPGDPTGDKQAAQRMVDLVVELTDHARKTNPEFFVIPQNGAFILNDLGSDSVRRAAYLDAIGGIAVEDLYSRGNSDENNPFNPDWEQIAILKKDFLEKGKPVFAVDYLNDPKLIDAFYKQAFKDGFIPYAAPERDLDRLAGTYDGTAAYKGPTDRADLLRGSPLHDVIDGRAGGDKIDARGGADRIHGGAGNDSLHGGDGPDRLHGGGGHDRLFGGDGRDTLYGGIGRDSINGGLERDLLYGGEGFDRLHGGRGHDRLFGDNGRDTLYGGSGDDRIIGGSGQDFLLGGEGANTFLFGTALGPSNIDTIADFAPGEDSLQLDDDIFTGIGKNGALASHAFRVGFRAQDVTDRIIYDETTGKLFYDMDGSGKAAAVQIALLDSWLKLTASEFDISG
jgi:cysteinyl-tRNA synthetase, unknown class